ncbi:MAG: cation diffusion facilitator family transporter [Coriobacteriia bacterium]|nr:cation diffusion facilitator family transporter [Coriobacteriia bacterium]
MSIQPENIAVIRKAGIIAVVGNAVLAIIKLVAGFISGSAALIGDGIDSTGDVLIGAMTLIVAKIISKPADPEHPWGHGRAEAIATAALSFIIFFLGAQLIVNSVTNLIDGQSPMAPSVLALIVTVISIVGKIILARSQFILGKRAGSSMIQANGKNMTGDIMISLGVLFGLIVSMLTGTGYADSIVAVAIGAWIVWTAIGIFLEANLELMDGSKDLEPYKEIFDAVASVEGASNPHRARMRRIGGLWDISFDIDVDPNLTVYDAHLIAEELEDEIRLRMEDVADIMIHVEPPGDDQDEEFGVSEEHTSSDKGSTE